MKRGRPRSVYIDLIYHPVTALGPGTRIGIWFRGCTIRCEGCIASHAWEFSPEKKTNVKKVIDRVRHIISDPSGSVETDARCSTNGHGSEGVTISGGEPFDQPEALYEIIKGIRELGINDILVYSGYSLGSLKKRHHKVLKIIDVLIDGAFVSGLESNLPISGSGNQKMTMLSRNVKTKAKYEYLLKGIDLKRELQIIDADGKLYMIGVPRQRDLEAIKKITG